MRARSFLLAASLCGPAIFFLFSASLSAAAKEAPAARAGWGLPVRGVPGVADEHALVNVGKLFQAPGAVSSISEQAESAPAFMPLPKKGAVPSEAVGRWQEGFSTPLPQGPGAVLAGTTPAPTVSFRALGDNNQRIPPDVHGAVGLNHVMTTLNSQVRIQNRSGDTISTTTLSFFWSSLSVTIPFDPKLIYDPYAGRWMITSVSNARSSSSSVLIGVSRTSDPTGLWNLYRVDADPTNRVWADYPSMGFNKKWIVVNVNLFTVAGQDTFIRSDNYAFNKADLYAGGAGLFTRLQDTTGGGAIAPALTYDTTTATMYLLEDWVGSQGGNGYLRLSTITGAVGSEVYNPGVGFPSTPNTWADFPTAGFVDFAPQLGSTRLIMCNDARMMNTVYRNGFLWCTHTIFLPFNAPTDTTTRCAVQWWKITPGGAVSQRGRMDDPTGTLFFAYPSIAVNKNNAALLGYSRFSANQYASGNYAYRIASDPGNTMRNDTVLKAGEAKYDKDFNSGANRWGDYTNTVVDPTNDLDMWTIQEYAALPVFNIDRWGTWWGRMQGPPGDCNANGQADSLDIALGVSQDCDSNGVPDECQLPDNDPDRDGRITPCDNCPTLVNIRGDMDANGSFTASDVVTLLNCTFAGSGGCDLCFADLNCDAQLSATDVVLELNAVFAAGAIPCTP